MGRFLLFGAVLGRLLGVSCCWGPLGPSGGQRERFGSIFRRLVALLNCPESLLGFPCLFWGPLSPRDAFGGSPGDPPPNRPDRAPGGRV
eukprot:8696058-Pyramimonas_sp.AAC.1